MAATATSVERELMELDRKYRDAMKAGDTGTLERLTADPCIVVGAQGATKFKRAQLGDMMRSNEYKLKSYKIDEGSISFRELGNGAAALAYKVHEEYDRAGKPQAMDSYNCSVWVKNGATWECAVHTESPASGG
jgi:ketosteroid isomerase-like protein